MRHKFIREAMESGVGQDPVQGTFVGISVALPGQPEL